MKTTKIIHILQTDYGFSIHYSDRYFYYSSIDKLPKTAVNFLNDAKYKIHAKVNWESRSDLQTDYFVDYEKFAYTLESMKRCNSREIARGKNERFTILFATESL